MAESFLTLYSNNSWTMENTPEMKRRLHWILQVIGCLAIFVGTGLEIYDKEEKNRSHFKSPHAITGKWRFMWTNYADNALAYLLRGHGFNPIAGLVSIVFIVLSMLNGWAAMYAMKIRHIIKPIYIKLSHYLCGIVAFVIGTYGYSTLHRGCNKICIFFINVFRHDISGTRIQPTTYAFEGKCEHVDLVHFGCVRIYGDRCRENHVCSIQGNVSKIGILCVVY